MVTGLVTFFWYSLFVREIRMNVIAINIHTFFKKIFYMKMESWLHIMKNMSNVPEISVMLLKHTKYTGNNLEKSGK